MSWARNRGRRNSCTLLAAEESKQFLDLQLHRVTFSVALAHDRICRSTLTTPSLTGLLAKQSTKPGPSTDWRAQDH